MKHRLPAGHLYILLQVSPDIDMLPGGQPTDTIGVDTGGVVVLVCVVEPRFDVVDS